MPVGFLVDPLSITMCMFITFVSAFIHLYSIGYMKDDRDYSKFFIYLNLFVFSMLLLVLADNLLLTFVGWEGVGVCSYWLVSFWFQRDAAASAGKKAFIYNRIGDVGFLLAIFLIFERTGTVQYESGPGGGIFGQLRHLDGGYGLAAVLLLFLAAAGKSAQIPLFNWLPDAMEGPTPVSALIHAATMVTAGVYLLCRMNPLLHVTATGSEIIATIGAVTAFTAATIACAQQDIKKVLAFSTVSQIGYMILAVGTGAYVAAIFLMVAHAFFKGLLFLGAGSVIHGLEDEQDLKRMGALRRYMKWTTVTFTIGFLAIAGIPPLSGFWAKGDVLDNTFAHFKPLWVIGLVTAVLTAYYMSRLEVLAFGGKERFDKLGPARRAGAARAPRVALDHAAPARRPRLLRLLRRRARPALGPHRQPVELPGPGVRRHALQRQPRRGAGVGAGAGRHRGGLHRGDRRLVACGGATRSTSRSWSRRSCSGSGTGTTSTTLVIGRPAQRLATFCAWVVDVRIIDGAVNGTAQLAKATGNAARKLQTGYARNYALGIALGHGPHHRLPAEPDVVGMTHTIPFLTLLILLPAIGAAALGLLGLRPHAAQGGRLRAGPDRLAGHGRRSPWPAFVAMKVHDGGFQLVSNHEYTGTSLGVHWYLGVDGISIFLVLLTALLFPLTIILGRNRENPRAYFAWILLLEASVMGSFLSLDLIVFFFMFELTLVPAYFIIAGWGHQRRAYAAIKFFLYTFLGSAFLLVGILALAFIHESQYHYLTFELGPLMQTHLSSSTEILLFLAFTAAFAVKAPLFPFHTWSPDAYTEAPEEGSVLLSGVLAKLGHLRHHPLRPQPLPPRHPDAGPALPDAGRHRHRLRRHRGLRPARPEAPRRLLVAGPDRLHRARHLRAEHAGRWPAPSCSCSTTGSSWRRCSSSSASSTSAAAPGRRASCAACRRRHPCMAAVFTVVMMASIGVPGLNGFVSEFLVLSGTFITHRWWAVVAVLGVIVAAIYLLWAYQQVFHGEPREADEKTRDLVLIERLVMAPLIILIVFLGVYPKPVLDRINPSVNQLIAHVESSTGHYQPSVAVRGVEGAK